MLRYLHANCVMAMVCLVCFSSDAQAIRIHNSVFPTNPALGNTTWTLRCNVELSSTQQLLGINLERRRSDDSSFSAIILFPSSIGSNATYVDTSLDSRTVGEAFTNGSTTVVSLTFNDAQCNDTAQYKWVISYLWNVYYTVERISNVSIYVPGTFSGASDYGITVLPGTDVKEHTTITVRCKADIGNNPMGTLAMYYFLDGALHHFHPYVLTNGHPIPTGSCSFVQQTEIYLPMTRKWNGMLFRCVLQQTYFTELGNEFRQSIPINVTYQPSNVMITTSPDLPVHTEGQSLILNCTSDANPPGSYTWQLPDGSTTVGAILVIRQLLRTDSGSYICKVHNGVPDVYHFAQAVKYITVEIPKTPSSTNKPISASIFSSKTVTLPKITTTTNTESVTPSKTSSLTFSNATVDPAFVG